MDIVSWLLLTLVFLLLVSMLVIGLFGLLAYRLTRRAGRGWLAVQARFMLPGPRREVMYLRSQLSKEVLGARRALRALYAAPAARGELDVLVRRLERVAQVLDAQLCLLQSEPDDGMLCEFLRPARARVLEVQGSARRVRQIAVAVLGGETDDTIRRITSDVDREVLALQAGVDALRALSLEELENRGLHR